MTSKTSLAFRNELKGVDAYTRHKKLIHSYLTYYGGKVPSTVPTEYKTEADIIRENHRFVRSNNEETDSWEQRVAKKYYDRLFKEYAICELKYYKEGKIALRWRVEREVVSGKGQFICASTSCESTTSLKSWEVNFGYIEDGEKKNELVKVRLCPECSDKLNYKTKKRAAKRKEKKQKRRRKSREDEDDKGVSTEESSSETDEEEKEKEEASAIWSKPIESKQEKSKQEEYEDYFADLLQ
ncbi:hypothetical protein G6F70_001149 [Rhizopus microsporus]|uniref:Protein FRA10AC1 n=2 Tax=Rhizopus TaxID=4842 RepID=A0A367JME9_RHIAZ|nr:hypothetical protein G6F71_000992 [Rhizopus microsporus]RCH90871.1 hypothetical protein CU097_010556 [Rhizopus azygosporus]KAG1203698.1 hypothetical protein G6F70_001149 [Rhizopus microsporus]KAG1215311.1 hypothetical protein G6F69_001130 [Rhizopus microsporus]KAG1237865.1 hypothetical protein G6F67_000876 [Rhizopus microsporus]